MRLVVTGATGWIGRALIKHATAQDVPVLAIGRHEPTDPLFKHPNIQFLKCDIQRPDLETLRAFQPTACVHLAWYTQPGDYWESDLNWSCLESSQTFLSSCMELGIHRFFVAGTCAEYLPGANLPIAESHPIHRDSDSAYVKSKIQLLDWLEANFPQNGSSHNWVWGRIFYPYGPGSPFGKLIDWLWKSLAGDQKIELKYPDSIKDFIHIQDVASAIWSALNSEINGPVNIGTGVGYSIREIAQQLQKAAGPESPGFSESDLNWRLEHPDPLPHVVADIQKLKSINWSPKHELFAELKQLGSNI